MKEEVIDLSSDGEECREDFPKKGSYKQQFPDAVGVANNQSPSARAKVENGLTRKDSRKFDHGTRQIQDIGNQRQGMKGNRMTTDQSQTATTIFLSASPLPRSPAAIMQGKQISRRFWKAGDYEVHAAPAKALPNGMDHVRVHPKFLHSNATSHKWALGAIAELLDNAIDEVLNGATFVTVDKLTNPLDNSPALLVQDDGGGMDPESMRHCMSLGYSRKSSNATIGQYGNGFKTSTMRLGADVIVFSRCTRDRCTTQSIGLLSYTFLRATGHEDIVVPMVDFELSQSNGEPKMLVRTNKDDWLNNLSTVLQWSPYTTESALLKQFDDIGWHGTKIIVYNLWMNDDGELELDFETDKQDIQVRGTSKLDKNDTLQKQLSNQHIANCLRFSLRAYASILYLRMPPNFQIILRGKVVEHLSIADDLKFAERILYKPQVGNSRDSNCKEVSVITTIGFAKEAPMVSVHGFNVYHKNRLIMPFWKVFQENSSRGRGVVGVLEANFIEPAHDKQDFERTPILQRLETRLKQMTIEYWNLHCELIGYQPPKAASKGRVSSSTQNTVAIEIPGTNPCEGRQGETSAPSTPPQPGSDTVCNQSESMFFAKGFHQKLHAIVADDAAEGAAKSRGPTGGHKYDSVMGVTSDAEVPDSALRKRLAAEPNLSGSSKCQVISEDRETSTSPGCQQAIVAAKHGLVSASTHSSLNVEEIIDELDQLRARCEDYKCREEELRSKVAELESELCHYRVKYGALVGRPRQLKRPKEERQRN